MRCAPPAACQKISTHSSTVKQLSLCRCRAAQKRGHRPGLAPGSSRAGCQCVPALQRRLNFHLVAGCASSQQTSCAPVAGQHPWARRLCLVAAPCPCLCCAGVRAGQARCRWGPPRWCRRDKGRPRSRGTERRPGEQSSARCEAGCAAHTAVQVSAGPLTASSSWPQSTHNSPFEQGFSQRGAAACWRRRSHPAPGGTSSPGCADVEARSDAAAGGG